MLGVSFRRGAAGKGFVISEIRGAPTLHPSITRRHHIRIPKPTGPCTAIRRKLLRHIKLTLVLFRHRHRERLKLWPCRGNLLGSVSESRLETNGASMAGSETNFEEVPRLTEPDDDIRPEPEGDGGDLPSDEELEAMFGEEGEIETVPILEPEPDADAVEMSEEDIEDLEDPEPIESLALGAEEQIEDQEIVPDDIPDPDPIPMGFPTADEPEDEEDGKKSRIGMILTLVIVILLAGAVTGATIMRETVVAYWSGANSFFSLVGLRVPQPGDGLDLRFTDPKRDEKDEDKIIINLIVENTTEEDQRVPEVITKATDADGTVVQEVITQPPKRTVKPERSSDLKPCSKKLRQRLRISPFQTGESSRRLMIIRKNKTRFSGRRECF